MWSRLETHGVVAIALHQRFQQTAKGELQLRVTNLDIRIDYRLGGPFASHGVEIALDAHIGTKGLAV